MESTIHDKKPRAAAMAGGHQGIPWAATRRWLRANTFTPSWMTGRWLHPAMGYVAATLLQVVAVAVVVGLVQVFQAFHFPALLPLLAVVVVALSWGTGPSLLATLVGALLLELLTLWPVFSARFRPLEDVAGIVLFILVGVAASVTAGRTERARRSAEALAGQMQAILETMTDGVAVYDVHGNLLQTNAALRTLLALDRDPEYAARPFPERLTILEMRNTAGRPLAPEELVQARVLRGEVLSGANAVDVLVRSLDGRELELSVSGAPRRDEAGRITGAVLVVRDVTERQRLERRSHEALDALVAMAEALVSRDEPVGVEDTPPAAHAVGLRMCELTRSVLGCRRVSITALDPETGARRALAAVGLTPEQELAWQADTERAGREDDATDPALLERLRAGEVMVIDMTQPPFSEWPNPYGARTVLIAPMRLGEQLVGFLALDYGGLEHAYTRDEIALAGTVAKLAAFVLERERLQRERAAAQAAELALRQTNRRMNDFLSIVSHELRSPLTSALGNIQLAERRGQRLAAGADAAGVADQVTGVLELLERARRQINRQNRLVGDLLDLSRIEASKLELRPAPCNLVAIVREVVEEQRQGAPGRTIQLDVAAESVPVVADADRIAQVVTNFLTNALKYSPADRPVAVGLRVEDGTARVWVRDQGPGLSAADQAHIWERFYRAEGVTAQSGSGAGLGLGLFISKTLIERHQGQVGVDSTPGQGSTFWFTLPVVSSR